jgi:putative tryptophan/tyrosine transport system substrate-binding protein
MKRRAFIAGLGAAAAWPLAARAQQAAPVVGYLGTTTPEQDPHFVAAFRLGLSELGFVEGRNLAIEFRWAQGQYERLPELAADLVTRKVNVIAAVSGPAAALAAKATTTTIPFVFVTSLDIVKAGLVTNFNRPGGNATGIYLFTRDLEPKKLELLAEMAPNAATIAALTNPNSPFVEIQVSALQEAARLLGRKLVVLSAGSESEIDAAFTELISQRAAGLVVTSDPFFNGQRAQLVALAGRSTIPAIYEWREFATAGGLASYGTSITDAYRQAGNYTGRILKGEQPADLPVIQPTKFEFVINLKTAKALGLDISPALLSVADDLIE